MYLGDKVALEELKNCSICICTDYGIRNIKSEEDIITKNVVYIENILPIHCQHLLNSSFIISEGQAVRYKPISVISR